MTCVGHVINTGGTLRLKLMPLREINKGKKKLIYVRDASESERERAIVYDNLDIVNRIFSDVGNDFANMQLPRRRKIVCDGK